MFKIRMMTIQDLFKISLINLDKLTETFTMEFYIEHIIKNPELCLTAEHAHGEILGYIIAKYDNDAGYSIDRYKCHICAVTVLDIARGMKVGSTLVKRIESYAYLTKAESTSLFVRSSNSSAINFYTTLGYKVFKVLKRYYSDPNPEDALDMRKSLRKPVNIAPSIARKTPPMLKRVKTMSAVKSCKNIFDET